MQIVTETDGKQIMRVLKQFFQFRRTHDYRHDSKESFSHGFFPILIQTDKHYHGEII